MKLYYSSSKQNNFLFFVPFGDYALHFCIYYSGHYILAATLPKHERLHMPLIVLAK